MTNEPLNASFQHPAELRNFRGLNVRKLVLASTKVAQQVRLCADQNRVSVLVSHACALILDAIFAPRKLCAHRGRRLLSVFALFFHF